MSSRQGNLILKRGNSKWLYTKKETGWVNLDVVLTAKRRPLIMLNSNGFRFVDYPVEVA